MNRKEQQNREKEVIVTDGKRRMGTAGLGMIALVSFTRISFYFMLPFDDARGCREDYGQRIWDKTVQVVSINQVVDSLSRMSKC